MNEKQSQKKDKTKEMMSSNLRFLHVDQTIGGFVFVLLNTSNHRIDVRNWSCMRFAVFFQIAKPPPIATNFQKASIMTLAKISANVAYDRPKVVTSPLVLNHFLDNDFPVSFEILSTFLITF